MWPSPYFPFWPDQIKSATSIPDLSLCLTKLHSAIERGNYRSWIIYVTSKAESDHTFYYSFIWSFYITCFVYLFMYYFCGRGGGGVPRVFGFVTIKFIWPPPTPPPSLEVKWKSIFCSLPPLNSVGDDWSPQPPPENFVTLVKSCALPPPSPAINKDHSLNWRKERWFVTFKLPPITTNT